MKRKNHYVPRFYLRNWSVDGKTIQTYPLLVPAHSEARWRERSIGSVAQFRDLYTTSVGGTDSDGIENWLKEEFEDPAVPVFAKILADQRLTSSEWEILLRFAGVQAARTLASYLKTKEQTLTWGQKLLDDAMTGAVRRAERLARKGRKLPPVLPKQATIPLPVLMSQGNTDDPNIGTLKATFVVGREYFLWVLRERIPTLLPRLMKHNWCIVRPFAGTEWPTSDNPFISLNFVHSHQYDFNGGWDRKNGNLLFPLSPKHLLFTQIGDQSIPEADQFSQQQTFDVQRYIVENSLRSVFARAPLTRVSWFRRSHVDQTAFQNELREMREWHRSQMAALIPEPEI